MSHFEITQHLLVSSLKNLTHLVSNPGFTLQINLVNPKFPLQCLTMIVYYY